MAGEVYQLAGRVVASSTGLVAQGQGSTPGGSAAAACVDDMWRGAAAGRHSRCVAAATPCSTLLELERTCLALSIISAEASAETGSGSSSSWRFRPQNVICESCGALKGLTDGVNVDVVSMIVI
jgi:hypothetical protein